MTKVYIQQQGIPELPLSLVFWPNYKFPIKESRLFLRDIIEQYPAPFFTIVSDPKEADFFAVPFEFFDVLDRFLPYLEAVYAAAQIAEKKVLLFDYTDYVDRIPHLPKHSVLFRVSVYRHHKRENELVMPYFVEDLGKRYGIAPQQVHTEPIIGYCGQSGFSSRSRHLRAIIKRCFSVLLLYLRLDAHPSVHTRGIFWRRRAIRIVQRSGIRSSIVVRRFYSLHQKSGSFEPRRNRDEYVENLRECDLALCTRGDANASQRFYEALSASRIPLFLDTDCVLPLEELIDYDRVMLRVSWKNLQRMPELLQGFIAKLSVSRTQQIEREARVVYDEYLRMDRFFAIVFDPVKSPYLSILSA